MKDFETLTLMLERVTAVIDICGADSANNIENLESILTDVQTRIQDMGLTKDQRRIILNQVSRLKKEIGS